MDRAAAHDDDGRRPGAVAHRVGAGHGGTSAQFSRLDEIAIAYGFALSAVGMAGKGGV